MYSYLRLCVFGPWSFDAYFSGAYAVASVGVGSVGANLAISAVWAGLVAVSGATSARPTAKRRPEETQTSLKERGVGEGDSGPAENQKQGEDQRRKGRTREAERDPT